ncbi:MAG: hypothetical protein U1E23_00540 [Reyranellaceae bacterium]
MPETLTAAQRAGLAAFAATMIPASTRYGVPGADDPAILDDIARSLERDHADVCTALARLDALVEGSFAALAPARRLEVAERWRSEGGLPVAALCRVVVLCYYRDDRVMRALGQEPRPPFPKGHTVEPGDWSLLDPVRARPPIWRNPG